MTLTPADENFAARLRRTLPEAVFRPPEPRYLEEPRGRWSGQCGLLALPRTVEEVSTLVTAAAEARVPVVPYGGGTGLVGGQIMPEGPAPLIVSLERMAAIRGVYPQENLLIAEAGAVLADVQAAAQQADRLFPLSLAAEGTARIGGNLATNAGGTGVLRYGNARDLCLGLEAVLPDGRIWHGLSRLRKDNTGYDLRNLLIGAEGTLGIITAATLKLYPRPAGEGTALFVVPDPQAAIDLLALARDQMGEGVSAFELISGQGLHFLAEELPDIRQPFATPPEWCVLIEVGLARGLDPEAALAELFEAALERGFTSDGLIAQSEAQRAAFWSVREHIPVANRRVGAVSSHDISVPIGRIPEFIDKGGEVIAALGEFRLNCFGHLGDGNLHFNVFPAPGRSKEAHANQRDAIKRAVHDLVHAMEGSVSAEHGIGRLKVDDLTRYCDPVKLDAMRAIKAALDPAGIMNPGAVLRG
ncbi:MAG: FAD-binding oxidoreductase [Antarcticimicrobium sp.]|uniref:FAD-binding oxidoreductase n=1 Tax=Antarcticimicrobium sp. TaxID=2824147 RepID=UPI00262E018C|nr:FAD-binding oxidoreductase [Antarcticimicrobium sp.]MDF1717344.1 FAD-binding oxidoreductase [Antarcticimicrobium sp.]